MNKLYLIDGMSLVFRAYHAMSRSGLKSPSGEPSFAVFAFTNILTSLLEKENPEHIAVVFDRPEPTFRHIMYPKYKANRDAFPEDLVPQLKRIKEFIQLINMQQIELAGYEADDIIGTISTQASQKGVEVRCLTSDKDYYQLVNQHVKLYKPAKNSDENFDVVWFDQVREKFGVEPFQVIDVLALIGDSSDNVPGVMGIGEKTAIPLIQKYGSLENIYEHIDEIEKAAVKAKLETNKEMGLLSKVLVTIKVDVPVDYDIDNLDWKQPDFQALDGFFKTMGFHSLRKKWGEKGLKAGVSLISEPGIEPLSKQPVSNSQFPIPDFQEPIVEKEIYSDKTANYIHVNTFEKLDILLKDISSAKILAMDLETSSLDRMECEIVGIAMSVKEGKGYYISVYDDMDIVQIKQKVSANDDLFSFDSKPAENEVKEIPYKEDLLPISKVIEKIKPILENPNIEKINQNIKFDAFILRRYGVRVSPITFDTMIASYLLNSDTQHNMDALSAKYLNYTPISITSLIGEKKSTQKSMRDVDPKTIAVYASEDADVALKLRNILYNELEKANLLKLATDIEFPLIEVLIDMEMNGVAIDTKSLAEMSKNIEIQTKELSKKIFVEAGSEFNIDSPKQLAFVLFDKMQIPPVSKTKTGFSTDVSVLSQLAPSYPIANMLLDYRQFQKLKSTYIDALPKMINHRTGRIHTNFNQTIAATGRLSSTDPNLQNIPIRTDLGKEVRKAFIPQHSNQLIMSADYSQVELRIMAYICGDRQLIESFKNGLDIHAATAAILYDTPLAEVTSDMRRIAKTVNFGIMYGLGSFGLSQRLGMGRREAQEIIDNYFHKYPGIKKYIDMTIKSTEEKGYAETICGRRRFYPNINSKNRNLKTADERAAINMPIQGTASDMIKLGMIRVSKAMKKANMKSLMLIQVHDELVFEVYKDEIDDLRNLVKFELENALSLGDVPVVVEVGVGENWFEAH